MKDGLEPVLFPECNFHALFHVAVAGQDPWHLVMRFLHRALEEGLIEDTPIVGRELTPLGHVAVLNDGRRRAFVYVEAEGKTYATDYTLFPTMERLRRWYRLARELGDVRFMAADDDDAARIIARDPDGIRGCPVCGGVNLLPMKRCVWCRNAMPSEQRTLPPASLPPGSPFPTE